jgi:UDP-N-acetylmuramate dehydrogenase
MDPHLFEGAFRAIVGAEAARRDAPLAALTTFRVGGPADWLIEVRTVDQLIPVLALAREAGMPVTVLGGGSNVLVADRGIRGVVIRLRLSAISQPTPGRVRAEAGVTINGLVRWTVARGLSALEAWAGTPGTVGGAIAGNAHYQGQNIGERVTDVCVVTPEGQRAVVARRDMEFAYDRSRIGRTREIVVFSDFAVTRGAPDDLRRTARASLAHRKRTQPLDTPSAGCVFQNPDPSRDRLPPGMPPSAGALVDRAGLKGSQIGGARVSPVHANFVVNDGHATAGDIRGLIEAARAAVRARFDVELREEVVYLGEW